MRGRTRHRALFDDPFGFGLLGWSAGDRRSSHRMLSLRHGRFDWFGLRARRSCPLGSRGSRRIAPLRFGNGGGGYAEMTAQHVRHVLVDRARVSFFLRHAE